MYVFYPYVVPNRRLKNVNDNDNPNISESQFYFLRQRYAELMKLASVLMKKVTIMTNDSGIIRTRI